MRCLSPLENKTKDVNDFFVVDVETWGLQPQPQNFALGVIYGKDGFKYFLDVNELKTELESREYRNKRIFAHNAEFDFSCIFGNIILNIDNSAIFNGKFIAAKLKNDAILADSTNIFPTSVKKIGETIGELQKGETPEKFIKATRYKGVNIQDIEYCIQDCRIVYVALQKIFSEAKTIKLTIASLSMYYFRSQYLNKNIFYSELNDEFFNSYFGGRTEAFFIGETECKVYDINSLYPYVMTQTYFPDFKNLKKIEHVDINRCYYIIDRFEGLFFGYIYHAPRKIGYLPYKRDGKLLFPCGTYQGFFNFNELRFAIDSGVVEIISCEYMVYGLPTESPFKSYINDVYKKRVESESELMKVIYKLFMNSLYGKFGMKKKYKTTYYEYIPDIEVNELKKSGKYYQLKLFSEKRTDCYLVEENEKLEQMFFSIASIASYITSSARIELLKALIANQDNLCYCDTDSIFINNEPIDISIGKELGQFKLENKTVTKIRGLKNYTIVENEIEKDVIKGVSKLATKINDNTFEIEKYYKTKEAIRRNKNTGENYKQVKVIKNTYDKRIVNDDGTTTIININDYEKNT